MKKEITKTSLLRQHQSYVKSRVWAMSRRGLPPTLEQDDLFQIGMIAVAKFYEKNDWVAHIGEAISYLEKAVDGAMIGEIHYAKYGVHYKPDTTFSIVNFSQFLGDSSEDEGFELLERTMAEQFSFEAASITPPDEPEKRLAIYEECSDKLRKEFKSGCSFEKVPGIYKYKHEKTWSFYVSITGQRHRAYGFDNRKDAAKAKFALYKAIQLAVLPIDLKGKGGFQRGSTMRKAPAKLQGLPTINGAHPAFLYEDPLSVMLMAERMYHAMTDDWTTVA